MKVHILFVNFLFEYASAVLYQKDIYLLPSPVNIISEEEQPSLLSCAQRCSFLKAEFIYNKPQCTCLVYLKNVKGGNVQSKKNTKMLRGTVYKVTVFIFVWGHKGACKMY